MANTNYSSWLYGSYVGTEEEPDTTFADRNAFINQFGSAMVGTVTRYMDDDLTEWMSPADYASLSDNQRTLLENNPALAVVARLSEENNWNSIQTNQAIFSIGGDELYKTGVAYNTNVNLNTGVGSGLSTQERVNNALADMNDAAKSLGLNISDATMESLARESVDNNYNSAQLLDKMFEQADSSDLLPGDIQGNAFMLLGSGNRYGVSLTLEQATEFATNVAKGEMTEAGVIAELANMGKQSNPDLANVINAGVSVNDYNTRVNEIESMISVLGGNLSSEAISNIALNSLSSEFDTNQLTQAVTTAIGSDFGTGDILGTAQGILRVAESNSVTMDMTTATDLAVKFINGEISEVGINSQITSLGIQQNPEYQTLYELGYNVDAFESMKTEIGTSASAYGLSFDDATLTNMATTALRNNYNETQIAQSILEQATPENVSDSGSLTADANNIKALANNYLYTVSDESALRYAIDIAAGKSTVEGLTSTFANSSAARYEFLRPTFDAGLTARDYFGSQIEALASTLEVDANSFSFGDPDFVDYLIDESGDAPKARTTRETLKRARGSSAWLGTDNARGTLSSVTKMLSDVFGRSGI